MASPAIEIIDLTGSSPQSPVLSGDANAAQSVGNSDRDHAGSATTRTSPIWTSEGNRASIPLINRLSSSRIGWRSERNAAADRDADIVPLRAQKKPKASPRRASENAVNAMNDRNESHLGHSESPLLFFLDDKPNILPADDVELSKADESANTGQLDLLLPGHIQTGFAKGEAQHDKEDPPSAEPDEDDFIHYADIYDSRNIFVRYYEEPESTDRLVHYVCGHCGAEGEHKTSDCPVLICLTCGAHNEHSTRQCPISKSCFTCGLKGHISKECTNRNASRRAVLYDDCNRCGSRLHSAKECPTLWRIYNYVEDVEREAILQARSETENLPFGEGGEAYIGNALWCYNCGYDGHLGDDCEVKNHPYDHPREPSTFSYYNTLSGPFSDRLSYILPRQQHKRVSRDDGQDAAYPGPTGVGKRGREKERERMRLREEELRLEEDEDDWFRSRLDSAAGSKARPQVEHGERKRDSKLSIRIQSSSKLNRPESKKSLRYSDRTAAEQKKTDRERKRRKKDAKRGRQKAEAADNNREILDNRVSRRHSERDYRGEGISGRNSDHEHRRDAEGGFERPGRRYYGGYGR